MSERSFSRHYAEATGKTPARAIERLRTRLTAEDLEEMPILAELKRMAIPNA